MLIFDTWTGRKRTFRPMTARKVGMYVCGVTVYDHCHLGHARSAIVFDVIRRYLEHRGYAVKYVRNFTDVDDKIINRANREGRSWKSVAETYIRSYQNDMARLGVRPATVEPKATDYVMAMVRMIRRLVKKGAAYPVDGDVYYRVGEFKNYGRLSGRRTEELISGARVEVDERKKDPLDFALWKASKPGEPAWDSPWGAGRPGWHIECSVMSTGLLGNTFDIHGGGKDLVFPHHENEIAQSEAATGKRFARYWVHNGFVTVNKEKMSKSLGNFFTVREIFEKSPWPEPITAEGVRYLLLSTHYRSPIDWSDAAFESAKAALDGFYDLFGRLGEARGEKGPGDREAASAVKSFSARFDRAMDDDFNTAAAIAEFQKLRATANRVIGKGISKKTADRVYSVFRRIGNVLGLFQLDPKTWQVIVPKKAEDSISIGLAERSHIEIIERGAELSDDQVEALVAERLEARRQKDWAKSDAIRKQLADAGILLEDRPDGTTRIKR
jgi:cysteinyl-tRNA synthetase